MKHNFFDKFKERSPEETISIISKFFQDKNCILKLSGFENESSTWSHHLSLFFNDNLILTSNGKGINEQFSKASAYSELYERFCNGIFYLQNPFICNELYNFSYEKNGYYIDPNEKEISFDDMLIFPQIKQYINSVSNTNEFKTFYTEIYNNKIIGTLFKNAYEENDNIYLDPRLLVKINASTGMAAGNSFYEAFNQGMSEICEHHVRGRLFSEQFDEYYEIDPSLLNAEIQNIINKIELAGNKIYLLDLSYNFHMPVVLSILINNFTNTITYNLGSFPILDIAIERILTELYQGVNNFSNFKNIYQTPFKSNSLEYFLTKWPDSLTPMETFPEYILLNLNKKKVCPNYTYFLKDNNLSNINIYLYYKNLCEQLNIKIYVRDVSLTENMIALQLFVDSLSTLEKNIKICKMIKNKTSIYLTALKYYNIIKKYLNTENLDFKEIYSLMQNISNFNGFEIDFFVHLIGEDWLSPYVNKRTQLFSMLIFINNYFNKFKNNIIINNFPTFSPFIYNKKDINKIMLLIKYKQNNNYTDEEIISFFKHLGVVIKEKDLKNFVNKDYWVNEIIFKPLKQFFNAELKNQYFSILIRPKINK